ncbi:hypothetical protein NE237_030155 [Protea cynaroides]|uniref:Uncharacterized protein n=1 Tax=Protea cynaroides TaxID=273540 RepID=A0A9Q0GT57_9MAGN|nr:hypothetical protein NE237_030155 [Protea cynaroides]
MFPSGDDFIIEFPGVSWLLWLHLLVMFLFFLVLLSSLGILSFHSTDDRPGSTSASHFTNNDHLGAEQVKNNPNNKAIKSKSNASRKLEVTEDLTIIKGHLTTSTRRIKLNVGMEQDDDEEEIEEMEESSPMVISQRTIMHFCVNPCYYLGQFFKPFLRCFGLPSTYQGSSRTKKGRNQKKL